MKKENQCITEKIPTLKSTLTFFNSNLTYWNTQRLQLNRSKGLAKYLAKSQKNLRDLAPLDTTLGVMSFSLYILRFSVNLGLLTQLILADEKEKTNDKIRRDLYYSLWNDCLWGAVNLTQFFWLSFRNSQSAGFHGMQLEVIAQLIDLLIMVIRHEQNKEEYEIKYKQASGVERTRLAIEWQHKELHFIRSLATASSILIVLGLFAFSVTTISISPIIFTIILISSLSRLLIDLEKDKRLISQITDPQQRADQEKTLIRDRLNDLNQIILYNAFVPLGLFLLITTPTPVLLLSLLVMTLIYCLASYLINTVDFSDNSYLELNTLSDGASCENQMVFPG